MTYHLLKLSSSANPDLNIWVSKLSKNSVLAVQMTRWTHRWLQCLSQDLETGCLKLAVVKSLGVQIFKGDHNILIFQP